MKNEMKIIFDIGANLGDFTQECLNRYPDTTVIAVEANDELVEKLKERFLNKNVIILNSLVSSKSGEELDFFISSAHTISTASKNWVKNSRFANTYEWNRLVKKRSITIDDLINAYGNPDLIKIDVEGYELEVIKGLREKQKYLCFEWTEEEFENVNIICDYLKSIGYEEFGFTYTDEYLKFPDIFSSWIECGIHNDIDMNRKDRWGMIWVK